LPKRCDELGLAHSERIIRNPTDDEIAGSLIGIISDGFNRSLGALELAGAVDKSKMRCHHTGIGSKFYGIVTEQIVLTAKYGAPGVRRLFLGDSEVPERK
jgi:hypothetical protein